VAWLRIARETLVPRAEEMVDAWRAVIVRTPQLVASFLKPDGKPDEAYKAAVKKRFVQWVSDLCLREHDQAWLDYQEEIGRRHTPAKKNKTDGGQTPGHVPLRYVLGFAAVVGTSARDFLETSGRGEEEIMRMYDAWTRAVMLSIALWARPYTIEDLW
jgi:Protoglobin